MEADERLRWLEARIASSLRPRGDELRALLADEENRLAFLSFCNHSDSRRLFVYPSHEGRVCVSATPPRRLDEKALFFLKAAHASRLSRESMQEDVVYSECSQLPLEHLELVVREVYLPVMSASVSAEKLLDLLHRLVAAIQVTRGHSQGEVVLPVPSIEVLAEAAMSVERRGAVIHVLESSVVAWMKQVKMAMHFDPSTAILRAHGKYAGPLAEMEFWSRRLSRLEHVRRQLGSVVVLNILHNLEQAHSTYAQAFIHVHRDVSREIGEVEHCLMYLQTLRPWLTRLNGAFSPDSIAQLFPPILATLLLLWQHSGVYSSVGHLHRLLQLLSNEVMLKARDIIGDDLLAHPDQSVETLRLALRVCAAFRGCYLDHRDKATAVLQAANSRGAATWPQRNSPVFASLNAIMERCNDLQELVQTVQDFRELEAVTYSEYGERMVERASPLVADISSDFSRCLHTFQQQTQEPLSLEPECCFEQHFFALRSEVRLLEQRLVGALREAFAGSPSLPGQLRLLQLHHGLCRRAPIREGLEAELQAIVESLLAEVMAGATALPSLLHHPPTLTQTPPTATKMLWLHALRERVTVPMETLKGISPELLEGDTGWRLRQAYSKLSTDIARHETQIEEAWVRDLPAGLEDRLKQNVLLQTPEGRLEVNFDPELWTVLREVAHLSRPPLSRGIPPRLQQLVAALDLPALQQRQAGLTSLLQAYHDLQDSLTSVERTLFQDKLTRAEQELKAGVLEEDWLSVSFPDYLSRARAAVSGDLLPAVSAVRRHTSAVQGLAAHWAEMEGLDVFREAECCSLHSLDARHKAVLERTRAALFVSEGVTQTHVQTVFARLSVGGESPAWQAFLAHLDTLLCQALKNVVWTAIHTLIQRAERYEQGQPIPPLLSVSLELQGASVEFSPPLGGHTTQPSVPEVVQQWMSGYTGLAGCISRLSQRGESFLSAVAGDTDIKQAVGKICAHIETSARQCQSLRKRFTIYSFLWEQDVGAVFSDFLRGVAPPHPRRFTRPETVRSRASARTHSASQRPKSSSQSQLLGVAPPPAAPPPDPLLGVMGVSDWEFLAPERGGAEESDPVAKRPSLDDFDGEIAIFQGVLERLANTEAVSGVGWVSVDSSPAQQGLLSLAAKWRHVFASHLERQVCGVLAALEEFFAATEPEVEAITGEESHTHAFMRLMGIFNKVNSQQREMDTKFGAVHRAVLMLDRFAYPLSPQLREQFNAAPQRWSSLKKRVVLAKQRIAPRIQAQAPLISQDLAQFGTSLMLLQSQFHSSRCLQHDCSHGDAARLAGGFSACLSGLQSQAQDLMELQELLETSVFNFSLLKEFEAELQALGMVWSAAEAILSEQAVWQSRVWSAVDCGVIATATEQQLDRLTSLPPVVRQWGVYQHCRACVLTLQHNLPLIEALRSLAMRPRHWKQVVRLTAGPPSPLLGRGGFFDPALLETLSLQQLLSMQLHGCAAEVLEVVGRAEKDIAIEALLTTLEEVWLSKQLQLRPHTRATEVTQHETVSDLAMEGSSRATPRSRITSAQATSIRRGPSQFGGLASAYSATPLATADSTPLLHNTASVFATLESHQTSLQSLVGTAAAAAFAEDLQRWHKQLQTIEAVLRVWGHVQQVWVQLEEVYGSAEVQAALPGPAHSFSGVDHEWRELMAATSSNPGVMATCLKEGLLQRLEKLQVVLSQCEAVLVGYVARQREACLWFCFMPLRDILQFVCYGSNLQQLSANISKLLHHAGGLVFNITGEPDHTPRHGNHSSSRITAVVSHLGEKLLLTQDIVCEGPIEGIISQLLSSISSTLQSELAAIMEQHLPPSSPLLRSLPTVWAGQHPSQITLLATLLALDHRLATDSLELLTREVDQLLLTAVQMLLGRKAVGVAASDSQPDVESVSEASSALVMTGAPSVDDRPSLPPHTAVKLQNIVAILSNFKLKLLILSKEPNDFKSSFPFRSMLHHSWSEGSCVLTADTARLEYGFSFTGSGSRLVLTPLLERSAVFLLQAAHRGHSTLLHSGQAAVCGEEVVVDLAVSAGRALFSLPSLPTLPTSTLTLHIRGALATGAWLLLPTLTTLPPSLSHYLCSLLSAAQQAWTSHAPSMEWNGDSLLVTAPCVCFTTASSCDVHTLPPSVLQAFQPASLQLPEIKTVLEVFFLAHDFDHASFLADKLCSVVEALQELFDSNHLATTLEGVNSLLPHNLKSLRRLKATVQLAQKHMQELCSLLAAEEPSTGAAATLQAPSLAQSELSENTRTSLKFRSAAAISESADVHSPSSQKQSLEEFALMLALKDTLLPWLPADTTAVTSLLCDVFTSCDVRGLIAHENEVRVTLAQRARQDDAAEESARESRAASAMHMVQDSAAAQSTQVSSTLEDQVVQCCLVLGLVPTPGFQLAASQLWTLVQNHRVVLLTGAAASGKTSVVRVVCEALRCRGGSLTTLAAAAMHQHQLLGGYTQGVWCEGVLPQLLSKPAPSRPGWIHLEGPLSPHQLGTILSGCSLDRLTLANGRSLYLDPSVRFIIELRDSSVLLPPVSSAARLHLLPVSVSWRDIVQQCCPTGRWSGNAVGSLVDSYLEKCVPFLSPLLGRGEGVAAEPFRLEKQSLQISELHLANMCCTILQCLLSEPGLEPENLQPCVVYAVVWACGGFLSEHNKGQFESWWHTAFPSDLPVGGSLWAWQPAPPLSPCSMLRYHGPTDSDSAPFVETAQASALGGLVNLLIARGCPVMLCGGRGSGKTALLQRCLQLESGGSASELLHLFINHSTTAETIRNEIMGHLEWDWGHRYTPKGCKRLVCFLDDIHLAQSEGVCELVRSHLATGSVCDPGTAKWQTLSGVSYVCTADCSVSAQLSKHFVLLHWPGYNSSQLEEIFTTVLEAHLNCQTSSSSQIPSSLVRLLVQATVQLHQRLSSMFLRTPDRSHYSCLLKHMAAMFRFLCMECGRSCESRDLLLLWQRETWWVYGGMLSSAVDRERFAELTRNVLRTHFNEHPLLAELLSGCAGGLPPSDLEACRSVLSHTLAEYNCSHPQLTINLYDSTVEEIHRLCHVMRAPHDVSHMIILGHAHPEPLVLAASLLSGHTLVKLLTSLPSSEPLLERFRRDLVAVYTTTGVCNERLLLLLTDKELQAPEFLTLLYAFIHGGNVALAFSAEERGRVLTAVRPALTQAGLGFSEQAAWGFFVSRVCSNLRVAIATSSPNVGEELASGACRWEGLVGVVNTYCHLPWSRDRLVQAALHHLKGCEAVLPSPDRWKDLAQLLAAVHLQLQTSEVTGINCSSQNYVLLVERFVYELHQLHSSALTSSQQVGVALQCVCEAGDRVRGLRERVEREGVVLGERSEACDKLRTQIGQDTAILKEHNKLLAKQRQRIAHLKKVVPDYQHAFELALEEKRAVVQANQSVVTSLDRDALSELRALHKPSVETERLLEAVITVVKGVGSDISWNKGAKRLMANIDRFTELLFALSASEDNSEPLLEALEPLLESFSPSSSSEQPLAWAQLHSWVLGVTRLHSTLQTKLRPLAARLSLMQDSLAEYCERLRGQEGKVCVLRERLTGLARGLELASVERSRQTKALATMRRELKETENFLNALSEVKVQWDQELSTSQLKLEHCTGSLLLSVVVAIYLSPLPPSSQLHCVQTVLTPLLNERGVELHCHRLDDYIAAFLPDGLEPPECDSAHQLSSHARLSAAVLSMLVPAAFTEQQLAVRPSLPLVASCGLVKSVWRRWPLVCDPHRLLEVWLQEQDNTLLLDARDRSVQFYQSVERAVVEGQPVLLLNFPPCGDPVLQSLLELAHHWDSCDAERLLLVFCGRRLRVGAHFSLTLLTAALPPQLSAALASDVQVIHCPLSLLVARDLNLTALLATLNRAGEFSSVCGALAAEREEGRAIDRELLDRVAEQRGREDFWWTTDHINTLLTRKVQVVERQEQSLESVNELQALRCSLAALATHAAMAFIALEQIAIHEPLSHTPWQHFSSVLSAAVAGRGQTSLSGRDSLQAVNTAIVQDMARVLDDRQLDLLKCTLLLLSLWASCNSNDPVLFIEQLLYLTQGSPYLNELHVSALPPHPLCMSAELWCSLHKLPLPPAYFSQVMEAVHTSPRYWEGLADSNTPSVSAFPWKAGGDVCLSDLVLLNCLCVEAGEQALKELYSALPPAVEGGRTLEQLLSKAGSRPVLLLYNEHCTQAQTNQLTLLQHINNYYQGRSVRVEHLSGGDEQCASRLLVGSCEGVLVVWGVQCGGEGWREGLYWEVEKAGQQGCPIVLLSSAARLPQTLLAACHTISLSGVATPPLPAPSSMQGIVSVLLSTLPPGTKTQWEALAKPHRPLVFRLAVLHAHISSLTPPPLLPAHVCILYACISHLSALGQTDGALLHRLSDYVREAYSCCLDAARLCQCMDEVFCEGSQITLGRLLLPVPSPQAELESYTSALEISPDGVEIFSVSLRQCVKPFTQGAKSL